MTRQGAARRAAREEANKERQLAPPKGTKVRVRGTPLSLVRIAAVFQAGAGAELDGEAEAEAATEFNGREEEEEEEERWSGAVSKLSGRESGTTAP